MTIIFAFTLLLCCSFYFANQLPIEQTLLDSYWTMTILSGPVPNPGLLHRPFVVTVPSTIHLNLQSFKQIPDPFYRSNIKQLSWVSACSVSFKKTFNVSSTRMQRQRSKLIFQGIDTYSKVSFNTHLLGSTNNAFVQYQFEITEWLKEGENVVEVVIEPTNSYDQMGQAVNPMPFQYAHTRKPCYQYGWDWAPAMNTMGIWKPVTLVSFDSIRIDYVWVRNRIINQQQAILNFAVFIDRKVSVKTSDHYQLLVKLSGVAFVETTKVQLYMVSLDVKIADPILWWPNGVGEPYIYDFQVQLIVKGQIIDSKKIPYGIKTVRLDTYQKKFTIFVNEYPIYCKGANYVPLDMQYPRLINPSYKPNYSHEQLLKDAKQSNFNMIRVWGGGQYESDAFYELASRLGIMIFQDFMFSDSIYPSTPQFLKSVSQEVTYQVRRLRNYPCLTLWSGNNEILQGIMSWGWSQDKYKKDYQRLFEKTIKDIVTKECKYIPYIASSPSKGVGNGGFERGGDVHFWGVWAAGQSFSVYKTAVGAFNSEFGTQSLPVWHTLQQFTEPGDLSYTSEVLLSHEKHNSRFSTLISYTRANGKTSLSFELETYQSGLIQANAIAIAIKAQRAAKPRSFGTLYWQMNDAWPAISWSGIDYYGRWKPLQYTAKRLYAPFIVFFEAPKTIKVLNDRLNEQQVYLLIQMMSFKGQVLFRQQKQHFLKVNEQQIITQISPILYLGRQNDTVIYMELTYGKKPEEKVVTTDYLVTYNAMVVPSATLNVEYHPETNQITVWSEQLIKSLYIYCQKIYIRLSDNYFDVVPYHSVTVTLLGYKLKQIESALLYRSYRQVYDAEPLSIQVRKTN